MKNEIEYVREPLRSQVKEIAEQQNMSIDELVEYVLRRYVEDFYISDEECADDELTDDEEDATSDEEDEVLLKDED